jgi:hypothetical protein
MVKARQRKIEEVKNGEVVKEYESVSQAATFLKISRQHIQHVLAGRVKTACGKVFRYSPDEIDGEEWKDHSSGFKLSNMGRVEYPTGKRTFGSTTFHGYKHIHFKKRNYRIHRLILEVFVGPCTPGLECDHIDRNRTNNHINNLRWVTKTVNQNNRKEYKNSKNLPLTTMPSNA